MKNMKTDSSAKLAAPHLSLQWTRRDDIDLLMWLCKATNKSSCSVNKSHLIGETYKKQWITHWSDVSGCLFQLCFQLRSSVWEFLSPSFCLLLTLTLFQTLRELPDEPLCNTNAEITFWMINVYVMSCHFFGCVLNQITSLFSIISGLYCLSEVMKWNQVSSCHCDYIQYTRFPCWMTGFRK